MNQTQLIRETYELAKTNQSNYPLEDVVRRFNLALDEYFSLVTTSFMNGTYVDRNITGIPSKKIDLVAGQHLYDIPTANDVVRVLYVRSQDDQGNPYILGGFNQRQNPYGSRFLTGAER